MKKHSKVVGKEEDKDLKPQDMSYEINFPPTDSTLLFKCLPMWFPITLDTE